MREWNSYSDSIMLKDGSEVKEYTIRFKTTEYDVYKRIEKFFQRLIDESNSSEKPNNCETCKHYHPDYEAIACERCLGGKYSRYEPKTEPHHNGEVTEMVEPQTDIEIARAIVHKAIDDTPIAEDAYPDLRQKMHDVVDAYEPQTERSE